MRLSVLTCAAFLTGCGDTAPRVILAPPVVPADLRRPVVAVCPAGESESAIAVCLIRRTAGLDQANRKLAAIDEILTKADGVPH